MSLWYFANCSFRYANINGNCHLKSTSTVLWQPHTFCFYHEISTEDISPYFSNRDLKALVNEIETKFGIKKLPMSMEITTKMIGIAEDLVMGVTNRDKAAVRLLDLGLPANENKFINCIINLIRKLPAVPIAEETNELELSTRYADPFLSGLFDDLDEDIYLRWTNKLTLEARQHENLSSKRPDICISRLHGTKWASNHGYGEAKSATQEGNNYSLCYDLLHVGTFCKNALDTQNMEGVLGLQIVGRMVTSYVLVLPSTGLYVLYELEKIKIPNCLDGLTKLIVDMPRVCRVLETLNRICKPSSHPATPSRHRPTIAMSVFNNVFSLSQDRKRSCHLKYQHN